MQTFEVYKPVFFIKLKQFPIDFFLFKNEKHFTI